MALGARSAMITSFFGIDSFEGMIILSLIGIFEAHGE
jgi:hypothetical protein